MAKVQGENPKPGLSKGKKTGLAAAAFLAVIALAAVGFKLSAPERLSNYAKGTLATMKTPGHAGQVPPVQFMDADGKLMTIDDLKGQVVVMNLWATWCGPCKAIAPMLDDIAREYTGKIKVAKVNVDENQQTPQKYGIRGIPTLMLFKGGNLEATKVGALSKSQLAAFLDSNI